MLEIHNQENKRCGKIIFAKPTKEEEESMPEFGGTYQFCECTGYRSRI